MNKDNFWGYLFAGVSALAGIIYLLHAGKDGGTVINNFPPLDTEAGAQSSNANLPAANIQPAFNNDEYATPSEAAPAPTDSASNSGVNQPKRKVVEAYPVYIV